jgi:hypothetical protein
MEQIESEEIKPDFGDISPLFTTWWSKELDPDSYNFWFGFAKNL